MAHLPGPPRRRQPLPRARRARHRLLRGDAGAHGRPRRCLLRDGAGKSTGGLSGDVVMDTTLSNPEHSEKLVQAALDAGKNVQVVYTYRPIQQAFEGVLDRARVEGRTASIGTLIGTHEGAAQTVRSLVGKYTGNPDVRFWFIDNSGKHPARGSIALTQKQDYRESREQLYGILESQRAQIPEHVYQAAQGTD